MSWGKYQAVRFQDKSDMTFTLDPKTVASGVTFMAIGDPVVVNLPEPEGHAGFEFRVMQADSSTVTVNDPAVGEFIVEGADSADLVTAGAGSVARIFSNGIKWYAVVEAGSIV